MIKILSIALATATLCPAANFYISASGGNDTHDGRSQTTPWKSLAKVNATTFGPGDSVLFKGGESWSGKLSVRGRGSATAPLIFSRYGSGTTLPHIDAAGATEAVYLKDVEHFRFEKFKITNTSSTTERRARGIVLYADEQRAFDNITIHGNELTDIIGDSRQATRYLNGSIFTDSRGSGHFTNLVIEHNTIHDVTVRGITGNQAATNWENPETMHQNVIVRRNYIDNIGADGIRMIACRNLLVEHNTVLRCGANNRGMELSYIAACFPQQCVNTTWQHNEVAYTAHSNPVTGDEDSQAFDVDWGCGGTHIFQYNYSHDNVGGFFLFMGNIVTNHQSKVGPYIQTILRYNVSINDGMRTPIARIYEIHPFDGQTLPVIAYNNTFINKQEIGIHLKNLADYNGLAFFNNIFVSPKGTFPAQKIVYDNNLHYLHSAPAADLNAVNTDPLIPLIQTAGSGMEGANAARPGAHSPVQAAGKKIDNNGGIDFAGSVLPATGNPDMGAFQTALTALVAPAPITAMPVRPKTFFPATQTISLNGRNATAPTSAGIRVLRGGTFSTITINH